MQKCKIERINYFYKSRTQSVVYCPLVYCIQLNEEFLHTFYSTSLKQKRPLSAERIGIFLITVWIEQHCLGVKRLTECPLD